MLAEKILEVLQISRSLGHSNIGKVIELLFDYDASRMEAFLVLTRGVGISEDYANELVKTYDRWSNADPLQELYELDYYDVNIFENGKWDSFDDSNE